MMDGLSATSSVLAVLQVTVEAVKYFKDIKDAPKECQHCQTEASTLLGLLNSLYFHLQREATDDAWFTSLRALTSDNGPFDQYREALERMLSKVDKQGRGSRIKTRMMWKFTKEEVNGLLERIERVKSLISIALGTVHFKLSQAIKDDTAAVRSTQATHDQQAILRWLSPTDFPAQQHDYISRRQEGTAQWFLDSPEFKRWVDGTEKTLLCPGIPGAGKTMMASVAISYLSEVAGANGSVGVAYVFCSYKARFEQSGPALLAAILKQLAQPRADLIPSIKALHDEHRGGKASPDKIYAVLQSVCAAHGKVYVIVDALDEYGDRDGIHTHLIDKLLRIQDTAEVRLLFTSRFIPTITDTLKTAATLEIRASEEDVRRYVEGQLPRLPACIRRDQDLQDSIVTRIGEAIDGMFLLARLHIESLRDKRNKQRVISTLDKISRGSNSLQEAYSQAYDEAIERIDNQSPDDTSLAKRALSWIRYAKRHLAVDELCCALAIELGETNLNPDNVYDIEDITSTCAGLVTVDEETRTVRLVHYTTDQYFEQKLPQWSPQSEVDIAAACLTYLCFDPFKNGACRTREEFWSRLNDNVLCRYAAQFWSEHVRPLQKTPLILKTAALFLCDTALIDSFSQLEASLHVYGAIILTCPSDGTGIHIAAVKGLQDLLITCLEDKRLDPGAKDRQRRTPLWLAASRGHEAIVRLLLETGNVYVDSKDRNGQTPLSTAAEKGHEAVVRLLLQTGMVNVNDEDKRGQTPFSKAIINGSESIARLFLATGEVDLNPKHRDSQASTAIDAPLLLAASWGREAIVKLILSTGQVDVNSKDKYGRTALSLAVRNGHTNLVKLLVNMDKIEPDLKDSSGHTPLFIAVYNCDEAVVRLLLGTGKVNINSECNTGGTVLFDALSGRDEQIAMLLLEADDTVINSKDHVGQTPLSHAAGMGHKDVVQVLVNMAQVEVDPKDYAGRTPLSHAARAGNHVIVQLLLDTGKVDMDSKDNDGRTPLSYAAGGGKYRSTRLLLQTGKVDADSNDYKGRTPLSWAAECGWEDVVQSLLETGKADVNAQDKDGRTALSWAVSAGEREVVQLLLATGKADKTLKDKNGMTPLRYAIEQGDQALMQLFWGHPDQAEPTLGTSVGQKGQRSMSISAIGDGGVVGSSASDDRGSELIYHVSDESYTSDSDESDEPL